MRFRLADSLDNKVTRSAHAHWEDDMGKLMVVMKYRCSNCGNRSASKENYCSYCGARMDEVRENAETN